MEDRGVMTNGDGIGIGDWRDVLARRLFEQRVVLLGGSLDDEALTRAAAELMTLDADGDAAISLRLDCSEGTIAGALTLMDVIELLGVPVRALGLGQVSGPAVGILAVCGHRAAMPSTRFMVREPSTQMEAHARDVARWAQMRAEERQRFCDRLAQATGQPPATVAEDLSKGLFMGADEALTYGLIDEISRPEAEIHHMPGPPIGFRPRR
jgi:ATP-dependent Clp protease, protease subunit